MDIENLEEEKMYFRRTFRRRYKSILLNNRDFLLINFRRIKIFICKILEDLLEEENVLCRYTVVFF